MTTDGGKAREFLCGGRTWHVASRATREEGRTGLYFRSDRDTRFLAFTRGALSSTQELESMSDEVLCVLLLRAVAG